jgi:hypothetical protein
MQLRILSWNIRGLNNPQKCERVKFWLRQWKYDIICLQETKLESVDRRIIRRLWGNPYVDWEVLEAVGISGWVLMLRDKRVVEKLDSFVGRFSVSCLWRGSLMVKLGLALGFMVLLMILPDRIFGWNSET